MSNKVNTEQSLSASRKFSPQNGSVKSSGVLRLISHGSAATEHRIQMDAVIAQGNQNKSIYMVKMLMVIVVPIITLITLSSIVLANAVNVQSDTNEATDAINLIFMIDNLTTNLQIERGLTATFLSGNSTTGNVFYRLVTTRLLTDRLVDVITIWPAYTDDEYTCALHGTKQSFLIHLDAYRRQADILNVSISYDIHFYTDITNALMTWADASVKLPEKGSMWKDLVISSSMLRISDALGIQRALGSTFNRQCNYDINNMYWFINLDGRVNALKDTVFSYDSAIQKEYSLVYEGTELETNLNSRRAIFTSSSYRDVCNLLSEEVKISNSLYWFDNMTAYLTILKDIRNRKNQLIIVSKILLRVTHYCVVKDFKMSNISLCMY